MRNKIGYKSICKSILSLGMSALLFQGVLLSTPVLASTESISSNETQYKKLDNIQESYIDYIESLGDSVKDEEHLDLSDCYKEISSEDKLSKNEIINTISDGNKINTSSKLLRMSEDEREDVQVVKTVTTKNNMKITFYNNSIFSVENLNLTEKQPLALSKASKSSTSGTQWAQAYRDYYSITGVRIFSVGLGLGFKYDGKKATYSGNFKAYYKKGNKLNMWKVSDWEKDHYSSGKNYKAYCQGNFTFGVNIEGNEINIDEMVIRHDITCYPDGEYDNETGEI